MSSKSNKPKPGMQRLIGGGYAYVRKEPICDEFLLASVTAANGKHDKTNGHYAWRKLKCDTYEEAVAYKDGLYLSKKHFKRHPKKFPQVSVTTKITEADGKFYVEYCAIHPDYVAFYMINKYGEDRTKWPYQPGVYKPKED